MVPPGHATAPVEEEPSPSPPPPKPKPELPTIYGMLIPNQQPGPEQPCAAEQVLTQQLRDLLNQQAPPPMPAPEHQTHGQQGQDMGSPGAHESAPWGIAHASEDLWRRLSIEPGSAQPGIPIPAVSEVSEWLVRPQGGAPHQGGGPVQFETCSSFGATKNDHGHALPVLGSLPEEEVKAMGAHHACMPPHATSQHERGLHAQLAGSQMPLLDSLPEESTPQHLQ